MKRLVRLETSRLILRPIEESDFDFLYETMNGPSVRSVWEHEFERKDIEEWIERRRAGYRENGYDYMLALHRETGEPVGQAGLLKERLMDKQVLGIGYIMSERHMGKGYATECARGLAAAAFDGLGQKEIYCDIRPRETFLPSLSPRSWGWRLRAPLKNFTMEWKCCISFTALKKRAFYPLVTFV